MIADSISDMKTIAIIQARMSSERLPEKVIRPLNGIPMIVQIYNRVNKANHIDNIIVATSTESSDDKLIKICQKYEIKTFRGSLNNVLERFFCCATKEKADVIVRLTGDNALVDSGLIDKAIEIFNSNSLDYLSYCKELPLGMSTEVFSYTALERTYKEAKNSECKEHVTLFMYKNGKMFKWIKYSDAMLQDNSKLRLTADTLQDWKLIENVYNHFAGKDFSYRDILEYFNNSPQLASINQDIKQKTVNYNGE